MLVHGSPGRKEELDHLASQLARRFQVIVPDLPGFGASERSLPDYSFHAHAVYLEQLLDILEIRRAHVVGFSMGGGVVLNLADIAPSRLASLTMLSAIGVQEMELTGDYRVNHAVHAIQLAALWLAREAIPHFGVFDGAALGVPYARNFFDSDQRPLRNILRRVIVPTLIIHGTGDGQVPIEAAREHARLVPQSELVTLDGDHFLAFTQPDALADRIADFLVRVQRGVATDRAGADRDRLRASLPTYVSDRLPVARGISAAVFDAIIASLSFGVGPVGLAVAGTLAARGRVSVVAAMLAAVVGLLPAQLIRTLAGRPRPLASVAGIAIDTPSRLILWDLARATGGVIGSAAIAAAVAPTFRLLSPSATAANALSICIGAVALSVLFSALSHSTRRT